MKRNLHSSISSGSNITTIQPWFIHYMQRQTQNHVNHLNLARFLKFPKILILINNKSKKFIKNLPLWPL